MQSAGKKIGLFGISANPPHNGHVKMARYARDTLGLDEIWFIVAAQNPLKSSHDMAPFKDRLEMTHAIARPHKQWLKVSDVEDKHGVNKSYDMLKIMQSQYTNARFVWIIGGDNLAGFHKWYKWQDIMDMVPIAVMARQGDLKSAVYSPAARHAAAFQIKDPQKLADYKRGWLILDNPLVPVSSTELRAAFKHHPKKVSGTPPAVIRQIQQKGLYT